MKAVPYHMAEQQMSDVNNPSATARFLAVNLPHVIVEQPLSL